MTKRRDILVHCLRGGALLALGGMASNLAWHSLHNPCPRANPCGGCPLFDGCGLPKAVETKARDGAAPVGGGSNKKGHV